MKIGLLEIVVTIIILSSIIFVIVWNVPEECDEECALEPRRIGSGQGAQGIFEPFEKPSEIKSESSPIREEHYEIEITGMKKIYRIGEQYDFSHVISGYGHSCGSLEITFPDQNGNTMKILSEQLCLADLPMKDFVLDAQKQYDTTSVHGTVKVPGIYNVTVTFDRPSPDFPTTATKEFRVPPINSWHNNQMKDADLQAVIDSCAKDSPKERMTNSLSYRNDTHFFMNLGCEWGTIGKYVGN